jgi:hypothetical protein
VNHPSIEADLGAGALAVAGLYHRRRVVVRLASVTLLDDHERDSPIDIGTYGEPPADIVPEVTVRYDPYLPDAFGITGAIVHERLRSHRTAPYFTMNEGDTLTPGTVLFEGPVFDAMTTFELDFDLREVDSYRRYGVTELPSGDGSVLVSHRGSGRRARDPRGPRDRSVLIQLGIATGSPASIARSADSASSR